MTVRSRKTGWIEEIVGPCARCGSPTADAPLAHRISYFNGGMICMACSEREQAHPLFVAAKAAEAAAVEAGDYDFPGIGCPPDLYLRAGNA